MEAGRALCLGLGEAVLVLEQLGEEGGQSCSQKKRDVIEQLMIQKKLAAHVARKDVESETHGIRIEKKTKLFAVVGICSTPHHSIVGNLPGPLSLCLPSLCVVVRGFDYIS